MFATATRNFVQEVDPGGLLVPVSSLSDTIALLTVVVKRRRFWFWQKPKYLPTGFNLNDILTGETPVQPVVVETDFLKYSGTYGDNTGGAINASFAHSDMSLAGKDSSKLQSSFGSLKKEEVDVQKLLHDSKDRLLLNIHPLSCLRVLERIVTTQPCSVIEEEHQARHCGGGLSICGPKSPKVEYYENGSLSKDSNVTMEIPTHTTIAYALIELEIKHDGRYGEKYVIKLTDGEVFADLIRTNRSSDLKRGTFLPSELCLMSDTTGGFEVDRILYVVLSSAWVRVRVRVRVTLLHAAAHERLVSLRPVFILCLGRCLSEMTDDCLAALGMCCSPTVLQTMELLVSECTGLTARTDVFENIKDLFASSNVSLERDGDTVRTEIDHHHGNQPLVLCIAVRGLASLA
uniref:Gasdermin Eb n=1 Tax=Mastacembelus armatus TaxID=205130 RepID=A0A7N8YF63_9TELE